MDIIAHRGFAGDHVENTMAAFHRAAPLCDMIEFDVRLSKDGVPVIVHDTDLLRLTGIDTSIRDCTARELADVDLLESGLGIPRLDACLSELDVPVLVEVKTPVGIDAVKRVLERYDGEVLVQSRSPEIVAAFSEEFATGLLYLSESSDEERPIQSIDEAMAFMDACGGVAINPHYSVCDEATVTRLQDRGFAVYCWTIRDAEVLPALRTAGVDGAIVDRVQDTL